jgi:hypothetical protein
MAKPPSTSCKNRLKPYLKNANIGQAFGAYATNWYRHFLRTWDSEETPEQRTTRRNDARNDYTSHVINLEDSFSYNLYNSDKSLEACRTAATTLGEVSHSWQDFFGHGVKSSGDFENGSTTFTAAPDSVGDYWPASYGLNGEHLIAAEPINGNGYTARYNAAQAYTTAKYVTFLTTWLEYCGCHCGQL